MMSWPVLGARTTESVPELDAPNGAERNDHGVGRFRVVVGVEMHGDHAEAGIGIDPVEHEAGRVGQLDLDDRRFDAGLGGERRDRAVQPLDEGFVRALRDRRPDPAQKSLASSAPDAPMCARPSFVIVRPRGVRWMKPSCSR